MTVQTVELVRILPTAVWIEDDIFGGRHVMLQHEGMEPFCYASFHYGYAYTSNSGTHAAATDLAKSLGAVEPIERRMRKMPDFQSDPDMLEALYAALEFIEPYEDVRDGDEGEQLPNDAMSLARTLREIIEKAGGQA